jgi:long-chain acyl-CoA synthetase
MTIVDAPRPLTIAEANVRLTAPGSRFEVEEILIRGAQIRAWKNGPKTLTQVFEAAERFSDRTFLVLEEDRVSFEGFMRATRLLAERLAADGVGKGDRVAIVMRNLPEWPVAFFAAAILGAIVTPLNAWWTGPELAFGLSNSGAKVALVDGERLVRIEGDLAGLADLEKVYVARAGQAALGPKVERLEAVIDVPNSWADLPRRPSPVVGIEPEDEATIFYTSGTTGTPKGALGTHRNITTNLTAGEAAMARRFVRNGQPLPTPPAGGAPQRCSLLVVPFFHVTGCIASLVGAVHSGGKIVLMRKWDALEGLKLIERERVSSTGGVPTIAWQLIEHPEREKYDLSSLEGIGYGGAPSAPELVRRIKSVFPTAMPANAWGMTETSSTAISIGGEDYEAKPDSCGLPNPTGEFRIVGAEGETLPSGLVGELWFKGPNVVKGYWNRPDATAETFVEGWVKTGDLARTDEDGFCYIVDRAKDMLIRGGENIYCVEVENALYEHPAVMDAAVVGIPHRTLGEEPAAVVTLKPGASATQEELRAFVAARLAAFKVPVKIAFSTETLPRNANGKIIKPEVKKVFEA